MRDGNGNLKHRNQVIHMVKKKNLILISALAIIIVSASLIFVSFNFLRFKIPMTPINPEYMGVDERLEDFEYLYNFVKENYPYLSVKERMHGYNWLDLKNVFEEQIKSARDNEEFLIAIMGAIDALQNRHTSVMHPEKVSEYHVQHKDWDPVNKIFSDEVANAATYWLQVYEKSMVRRYYGRFDVKIVYDRGDYIIYDDTGSWDELHGAGSKVTKVNGIPIDDAVKTCYDKDYLDWDFR